MVDPVAKVDAWGGEEDRDEEGRYKYSMHRHWALICYGTFISSTKDSYHAAVFERIARVLNEASAKGIE